MLNHEHLSRVVLAFWRNIKYYSWLFLSSIKGPYRIYRVFWPISMEISSIFFKNIQKIFEFFCPYFRSRLHVIFHFLGSKWNPPSFFCLEFLCSKFHFTKSTPFCVKYKNWSFFELKCVDLKISKTAQCGFELKNEIWSLKVFKHDEKKLILKFRVLHSLFALFSQVVFTSFGTFSWNLCQTWRRTFWGTKRHRNDREWNFLEHPILANFVKDWKLCFLGLKIL